jgi:hypothetical protein
MRFNHMFRSIFASFSCRYRAGIEPVRNWKSGVEFRFCAVSASGRNCGSQTSFQLFILSVSLLFFLRLIISITLSGTPSLAADGPSDRLNNGQADFLPVQSWHVIRYSVLTALRPPAGAAGVRQSRLRQTSHVTFVYDGTVISRRGCTGLFAFTSLGVPGGRG